MYGILIYAQGSKNHLGSSNATTYLTETTDGYWNKETDCN